MNADATMLRLEAALAGGLAALALGGLLVVSSSLQAPDRGQAGGAARVPAFGIPALAGLTTVADASNGLNRPRDLAFNPLHPEQLWVVNQDTDGTVMLERAGAADQVVDVRVDAVAFHFMDQVSGIAFAPDNSFGTCHESRNDGGGGKPDDFMGPTQWAADLDIYARQNQDFDDLDLDRLALLLRADMCVPKFALGRSATAGQWSNSVDSAVALSPEQEEPTPTPAPGDPPRVFRRGGTLGSHIDMLHQSPNCMGIAYGEGNGYWVTDGKNGHVVFYDFRVDHGYGGTVHDDGVVRRYVEAPFTRVPGVPGHLALDRASGWLYYADTGAGKVRRLKVGSGKVARALEKGNEPLAEFSEMEGVTVETFVDGGLTEPSGVAIAGGMLFVGDHADGIIRAYDLETGELLDRLETGAEGLMGLTLSPEDVLWFVDGDANRLVRVDPQLVVPTPATSDTSTPIPTSTQTPTWTLTPTPTPSPPPTPAPTFSPLRRLLLPYVAGK